MQRSQTHLPSLLGSILFALSGLFLLGMGLLMGFSALFSILTGEPLQAPQTILFLAFSFEAVVLFAAAFFTLQKTLQKPRADQTVSLSLTRLQILVCMLTAAAAILVGSLIGRTEPVNWLLLPFLTIPAVVLPLGVLLALGARGLPLGSRWQSWTVLGLGMSLTPIVLFVLEVAAAIFVFVGVFAYLALQPELISELEGLFRQVMVLGPESKEALELLSPLLTRPGVIVTALMYIALLVPAIEELLKPLGVWLLAGRLNSTAQGFTLGALSGAGYALIETVGVSGQAGEWASLLFTRIGTGLLHITTSALVGAAIVLVWREQKYLHLMGTYLLAVLLHGLWNAAAVLYTFSTLAELQGQPGRLSAIQPSLIAVMSLFAAGFLVILITSNRRMRRSLPAPHLGLNGSEN